eukprot:TRINITY_DN34242_c0_g1_i1.p1 TRINITY_DN34242_c0_g1~~TRINITY_DN34242_c0_g1_i1.p1  ORF type:complete len:367 (+),score=66.49 TRINITY_DN34242_c0_g1_i1:72-1172(+)
MAVIMTAMLLVSTGVPALKPVGEATQFTQMDTFTDSRILPGGNVAVGFTNRENKGFVFLRGKDGWAQPVEVPNPKGYLVQDVHVIDQGNAGEVSVAVAYYLTNSGFYMLHTYDAKSAKLKSTLDLNALTEFSTETNFGEPVELVHTAAYIGAFSYPNARFFKLSNLNTVVGSAIIPFDWFSSRYSGLTLPGKNGSFSVVAELQLKNVAETCAMDYDGKKISKIGTCVPIGPGGNTVSKSTRGVTNFLAGVANNTASRFIVTSVEENAVSAAQYVHQGYSHDLGVAFLTNNQFALCHTHSDSSTYTNTLAIVVPSGPRFTVLAQAVQHVPVGTQVLTPTLAGLNATHFYEYYLSVNDASIYEQLWSL